MILKFLWSILYPEPIKTEKEIKWFHIDKRYHNMTRAEKREYKRWLDKNGYWDGDIVVENIDKLQAIQDKLYNIRP